MITAPCSLLRPKTIHLIGASYESRTEDTKLSMTFSLPSRHTGSNGRRHCQYRFLGNTSFISNFQFSQVSKNVIWHN